MKPSRLFWGVLFIVLGGLLIAERTLDIAIETDIVWKLWPAAIILVGLAIIFRDERAKRVLAGLAAIVLACVAHAILSFSWIPWNGVIRIADGNEEMQVQEFTEPMSPDVTTATLRLEAAAGKYTISPTTSELFKARIESSIGEHTFSRTGTGDNTSLYLGLESAGERHSINIKRARNTVDIFLHEDPEWDLIADIGIASAEFDLSRLKVRRLDLEAGASALKVRVGEPKEECRIKVNGGATSIRISVPKNVGCEVRFDGGLSSKQLNAFERVGDGLYRTANFDQSAKKIFIDADVGVSSFKVLRE